MFCPTCGRDNPSGARFCADCGSPLVGQLEATPYRPPEDAAGVLPARDLGGLLSETFDVYARGFWPFVLIAFPPQIPLLVAIVTPALLYGPLSIVAGLLWALANAAIAWAVAQQCLGRQIDVGRCYGRAWAKVISLIVADILFFVALAVSLVLWLIVIGIPLFFFLLVTWFFLVQAIIIEGYGPTGALERSHALVKGSWWRVFGIGIAFVVIVFTLGLVGFVPAEVVSGERRFRGSRHPAVSDNPNRGDARLSRPSSEEGGLHAGGDGFRGLALTRRAGPCGLHIAAPMTARHTDIKASGPIGRLTAFWSLRTIVSIKDRSFFGRPRLEMGNVGPRETQGLNLLRTVRSGSSAIYAGPGNASTRHLLTEE